MTVAMNWKTKVPKEKPTVVYKRSFKNFCQKSYCTDVQNICWTEEYKEDQALRAFGNLLHQVINRHAHNRQVYSKCRIA